MDTIRDYIRKIGSDIHSMSFIIGAGFSKNISNKYLSWAELQEDMIKEMYANEIALFDMDKWQIIGKYGYLGIASEYIKRKGYHEAIDVYIEQRIPTLEENEDGTYDLILGEEREKNVDVSLQRRLLGMKVKNIYTFNYDNALDVYTDLTSTSERRKEISDAQCEIKQIKEALYKIERLNQEVEKGNSTKNDGVVFDSLSTDIDSLLREIKALPIVKKLCGTLDYSSNEGEKVKKVCKDTKEKLDQYKQQLDDSIKLYYQNKPDFYYVVKKSGDITISAGRNIFKLHGSLRDLKERSTKYGFDYDNHTQYIIAQEDYDTYNEKHEAFVDLMRISLLKDSYCIIGFSCDDPNFLLWINWVKDIVDKEKLQGGDNDIVKNKYFINVDDTRLDPDKKLLLSNHYIEVVNLFEVYPLAKTRKERLQAFFDDIEKRQSVGESMKGFWEQFDFPQRHSPSEKQIVKYNTATIDRVWNQTKDDELSFFVSAYDYYRFYFLESIRRVIKDNSVDKYICKAFGMAVNQDNLPLDVILENEYLDKVLDAVESSNDVGLKGYYDGITQPWMLLENQWEQQNNSNADRGVLYKCMASLFNFDFDNGYKIANEWNPKEEIYQVIRLMIITDFKRHIGNDEIKKIDDILLALKRESFKTDQEYLIALEFLSRLQQSFWLNREVSAKLEIVLTKMNEVTKSSNELIRLPDYFSKLLEKLHKEEKVKPLGREGRTFTFGGSDTETLGGIRVLQVLVKLGFVASHMISSWFSIRNLYDVIEKTYTIYPYPCLYYASLCPDKNMNRRMAQLFLNSSSGKIQEVLPDILVKILKACSSSCISDGRKNNLYIYAVSFIKRVDPKMWFSEFKQLFHSQGLFAKNDRVGFDEKYDFAKVAISYCKDSTFKQDIISEVLDKWGDLTHYDNSLVIAATRDLKKLDRRVLMQIYQVMKRTSTEPQVFVLFNLQKFISKDKFYDWVSNLDKKWLSNPSLTVAVSHVAKRCKRLQKLVLQLLSDSPYLWNTGINDQDTVSVSDSMTVDIDTFENNLPISEEAEDVVFKVLGELKHQLGLLDKAFERKLFNDWFQDWSSLIHSMKLFVIRHRALIEKREDVNLLIEHCDSLYFKASGLVGLQDKLVQEESYRVEEGISELIDSVHTYGIQQFKMEYEIIAGLVIQHQTKALDLCMRHLSRAFTCPKYNKFFVSNGFHKKVSLILRVYKPYFMGEDILEWDLAVNKNVAEKSMIELNEWLKSLKQDDADWTKYKPIYFQIED